MEEKKEKEIFYTKRMLEQKKREDNVVALFDEWVRPCITERNLSPERLMSMIAQKTKITVAGVKCILKRKGLYDSNKKLRDTYSKQ